MNNQTSKSRSGSAPVTSEQRSTQEYRTSNGVHRTTLIRVKAEPLAIPEKIKRKTKTTKSSKTTKSKKKS